MKQVDKSHYDFRRYIRKDRWISMWHQLDEVTGLGPDKVLEIGPGPGVFKSVAALFGLRVETLDLDPDLKPDHVGSATAIPLASGSFDVVCAFQVLEHLPYEQSLKALAEMLRVSRRHVVVSLPDASHVWTYQFHVPLLGDYTFHVPRPRLRAPEHVFDGEHYWELGKRGYPVKRFIADCASVARVVKTYRVAGNAYHRFFVLEHLPGARDAD